MTGEEMSRNVAECIDVAAAFLAAHPGAVQRALTANRRGPDGRCTSCPPPVRWPCTMATIARQALDHTTRASTDARDDRSAAPLTKENRDVPA